MCAFGILAALVSRVRTGRGQVVEANMVDGSAYLGSFMRYAMKTPMWDQPRGENVLDGGCPFYEVYESKDGGQMAVGALEPHFFAELIKGLGLPKDLASTQHDRSTWPGMKTLFRKQFFEKPRREWEEVFANQDACCMPVLSQFELEEEGYEQRPPLGLAGSPGLSIPKQRHWRSEGLPPGSGGEYVLEAWMGWKKGKDYKVERGSLVKIDAAKL